MTFFFVFFVCFGRFLSAFGASPCGLACCSGEEKGRLRKGWREGERGGGEKEDVDG
jgi:hypothetical protein